MSDEVAAEEAALNAEKGLKASKTKLALELAEATGETVGKDGKWNWTIGGAEFLFDDGNEEVDVIKILRSYVGDKALTDEGRNVWGNYGVKIAMDSSDPDSFID